MVALKPALEARGFEVAVFHATGMGGRAFESLAAEGAFAAVMDFAPHEVGNHLFGSTISAGPDRMPSAVAKRCRTWWRQAAMIWLMWWAGIRCPKGCEVTPAIRIAGCCRLS